MEFKIRNEFTPIWISLIILPVLWFISILFLPLTSANVELHGIALIVCVALMALLALALILYFVDKAIGAVIKVDDTTVKVSSLFVRKKIAIDEIDWCETRYVQRSCLRRDHRQDALEERPVFSAYSKKVSRSQFICPEPGPDRLRLFLPKSPGFTRRAF